VPTNAGAVASSGAAKGRHLYQRRLSVIFSRCPRVQGSHGGLRPPLLYCCANACRRKNDFCDAQTHARPRAAGVSPPWLGHTIAVPENANVAASGNGVAGSGARPRAAGVSPPWAWVTHLQRRFRKVAGDCRQCAHERQRIRINRYHGGLTPPALVLLRERLPAKKRFLRCTNARDHRSGGREPAVGVGNALAKGASAKSRETAGGVLTNAGAFALSGAAGGRLLYQRRLCVIFSRCPRVQGSHGGLTPPALVLRCTNARTLVGEKTIFAMHKRTLTRAAGISGGGFAWAPAGRRGDSVVIRRVQRVGGGASRFRARTCGRCGATSPRQMAGPAVASRSASRF
jgi:hypothetical protein